MKNIGDDYHNRIVIPFIRSSMKQSFGNFASRLLTTIKKYDGLLRIHDYLSPEHTC